MRLTILASTGGEIGIQTFNPTAVLHITRNSALATPSNPTYLKVVGVADTALTAGTEAPDVQFSLNRTVEFSTGALTNQRAVQILAPTYSFVGASTIANAATLYIDRQPQPGANATITNPYSLWVDGGIARFDGNGTICFEIGTFDTVALGSFYGRVPVTIPGVGTKYLALYN